MYQCHRYGSHTGIIEYLKPCTGFLKNNLKGDINMPVPNSIRLSFPEFVVKFISDNIYSVDSVKHIINNNPYTIVLWKDGTKTIVKCQEDDVYNYETGIAMCFMKKMCGNNGSFNEVFRKYCE